MTDIPEKALSLIDSYTDRPHQISTAVLKEVARIAFNEGLVARDVPGVTAEVIDLRAARNDREIRQALDIANKGVADDNN